MANTCYKPHSSYRGRMRHVKNGLFQFQMLAAICTSETQFQSQQYPGLFTHHILTAESACGILCHTVFFLNTYNATKTDFVLQKHLIFSPKVHSVLLSLIKNKSLCSKNVEHSFYTSHRPLSYFYRFIL